MADYYNECTIEPSIPIELLPQNRLDILCECGIDFEKDGENAYYLFSRTGIEDEDRLLLLLRKILREQQKKNKKTKPFLKVAMGSSCSKMRPGSFGGVAWFVTPKRTSWFSTFSFLDKQERNYLKNR